MQPRRLALSVQAGWVGSWPEWDLYGMGCRIACGKHVFAHGASEREVGTSFTAGLSQLYQCWILCRPQSHSVAPWPQFAFPQLHYSWRKGEKKEKKVPFGIEFASPSAQGVLGWARGVAHTREVLGARERGCTGDGVQPYGLSVQHFETAHQLQPKTSSDKNTQKKSWSLKMQITCDAECPCLCVIAKFLDSISQR